MAGTLEEAIAMWPEVVRGGAHVLSLDGAWTGVMVEYQEQDFPTSKPYKRTVPGWKCRACGFTVGTSGLPPRQCECGQRWEPADELTEPDARHEGAGDDGGEGGS